MTSRSQWEPRDPDVIGAAVAQLLDALELEPADVARIEVEASPAQITLDLIGAVSVVWPMTVPLPEDPA
jgi:hypothetical protein